MSTTICFTLIGLCSLISFVFATLTYSLRDFSRPRLEDSLERRGREKWFKSTVEHAADYAFVTAVVRMVANLLLLVFWLHLLRGRGWSEWSQYLIGTSGAGVLTLVFSVILPHAVANHVAEPVVAASVGFLQMLRLALQPLTKVLHLFDGAVRRATTAVSRPDLGNELAEEELESEIRSVIAEGEKGGLVDKQERAMLEAVIRFHDTAVSEVMTARTDIIGCPAIADIDRVREILEQSGHSRLPVYEGTTDHVIGILYARDLLRFIGEPAAHFDLRAAVRPSFFVPETKPLRDLLNDFRIQKMHLAIVLDEYGGTAGLVSIEDVLEELVGEISDEHEPLDQKLFKRLDVSTAEVDTRIHIDELNRRLGTDLPDDAGYDTLGGFISMHLGRIPEAGTQFEHDGLVIAVLEAEPQRVNRARVQVLTPGANDRKP